MIGFIALSGNIVRNSILLADQTLREPLLGAGAGRFKPILLIALDPIFERPAISLLFGLTSSPFPFDLCGLARHEQSGAIIQGFNRPLYLGRSSDR